MATKRQLYTLEGTVKGTSGRQYIIQPTTKIKAFLSKKRILKDLKMSIPKYKWVSNLKVVKYKE